MIFIQQHVIFTIFIFLYYLLITLNSKYKQISLHKAAEKGDIETVKLLIQKGAEINLKNKDGWVYFKIIKNYINIIKQTPLHIAVYNGHIEIVKLLIEKGCDINLKDNEGRVYFK